MIRKIIPPILMVLLYCSCENKNYYQHSETIPEPGWSLNQTLCFHDSLVSDAPEIMHFEINLRNSNIYPYQNIWLYIQTKCSDGTTRIDSIDWKLSDLNGRWLGSGWGSLYSLSYRLPDLKIRKTAPKRWFRIDIQHGLRDNVLPGIETVGVRLY